MVGDSSVGVQFNCVRRHNFPYVLFGRLWLRMVANTHFEFGALLLLFQRNDVCRLLGICTICEK